MSCDYQRYRIWGGIRSWYHHQVPAHTRESFENTIEKFVKNWIENTLDDEGKRAVRQYRKEKKAKPKPKPVVSHKPTRSKNKIKQRAGGREGPAKPLRDIDRHRIADPQDPFEKVYHQTKEIIVPGHIQWTDDQREEMAEKMHRVMHWMRVQGETSDANPIHGKHGLPRISSVASYAVVHDWLTAQGVAIESPFDSIYEMIWDDPTLDADQIHDLEHLIEKFEIERNKKEGANPEQEEEILLRIRNISSEIHNEIIKKFSEVQPLPS